MAGVVDMSINSIQGAHTWQTTYAMDQTGPLQTEWVLVLCESVFAPAPAAPPAARPRVTPRTQTDPAIY